MKNILTCTEAARVMKKGNMELAMMLRNGKSPFPFPVSAIPPDEGRTKWQYWIPARPFARYLGLTDEELEEKLQAV